MRPFSVKHSWSFSAQVNKQHVCFAGASSSFAPPSCCFAPHPPPIGCQPSKQLQLQSPPLLLQRAAGYLITPILHSLCLRRSASSRTSANRFIMTGVAAASFFSNVCRFGGCGLHFESLGELIVHIEDNHIDTDPRVLERQELQQPTYVALSYINRFMTEAARREQETQKKKVQPKIAISVTGGLSRNSTATPPRHSNGSLTPPVTPPITPSSSFRSSTPTGSECDEEEVEYEDSDSDESWTTESAISSESILSSMCMNGGDEKPFACPVPGCKKRYKNVNGIKYHAKNGHRTQIRVRKPFKCRCGKSYKTSQGLRHHTINFHPPL
ncbi:juxtaposed with another zinc finger protein 1a [Pseudorasbora parva]|uniref:juxtaposed with another zinc finger protein 1a n=1 Tax=Pseudorasbora parva TaxID=51549 RepID=UPI00351F100D